MEEIDELLREVNSQIYTGINIKDGTALRVLHNVKDFLSKFTSHKTEMSLQDYSQMLRAEAEVHPNAKIKIEQKLDGVLRTTTVSDDLVIVSDVAR